MPTPDLLTRPPLEVFPILLLILACVMFILAAAGKNGNEYRNRLLSAGLACWVLYILLHLIGGLVK